MNDAERQKLSDAAARIYDIATQAKRHARHDREMRAIAALADNALMDMASVKVPIPTLPRDLPLDTEGRLE